MLQVCESVPVSSSLLSFLSGPRDLLVAHCSCCSKNRGRSQVSDLRGSEPCSGHNPFAWGGATWAPKPTPSFVLPLNLCGTQLTATGSGLWRLRNGVWNHQGCPVVNRPPFQAGLLTGIAAHLYLGVAHIPVGGFFSFPLVTLLSSQCWSCQITVLFTSQSPRSGHILDKILYDKYIHFIPGLSKVPLRQLILNCVVFGLLSV